MANSRLDQGPSNGMILYEKWVNPQWVRLLDVLQMKVRYSRCVGAELHTEDGRQILDFNSGYCVHNAGHNHPRIKAAIIAELERDGAAMLQTLDERCCASIESLLTQFELDHLPEEPAPSLPGPAPQSVTTDLNQLIDDLEAAGTHEFQQSSSEARNAFFVQLESYRRLAILLASLSTELSNIFSH
jgi:hypothetical protein